MKIVHPPSTTLDDKYDVIFDAALSLSMSGSETDTGLSVAMGELLFQIAREIQGAHHPRDLSDKVVDAAFNVGVHWLTIVEGPPVPHS